MSGCVGYDNLLVAELTLQQATDITVYNTQMVSGVIEHQVLSVCAKILQ